MARHGAPVLSLPLLVLLLGSLLSHAKGVDMAKATTPPRLPMAVEGIIYCRSCKLPSYDASIHASPLPSAVARLRRKSSAPSVTVKGMTDKNGYFLIQTNEDHKGHKGARGFGAPLKIERIIKVGPGQQALHTAEALAFAPAKGSSSP